jgi:cytochrome P450
MSQSFKTRRFNLEIILVMNKTTTAASKPSSSIRRPPGPRGRWWGLSLLADMRRDYLGFTGLLHRNHGDISYMRLVHEHAYDLFSPELIRAVLVENADSVIRWERGIEIFEQVFGRSVLVTEGETWKRQRRMLQPAFSPKRIAGYGALMVDAAQTALSNALHTDQQEGLVDIDAFFSGLTMDVIMRTMFSNAASEQSLLASQATQVLSATAMKEMFMPMTLPDWLPLPGKAAKRKALRDLRAVVNQNIAARRLQPSQGQDDLLSMLLSLRDEETGERLSDQEIFDQCMVTFQAGHETSATALIWWSRLMAEYPDACEQATREVDALLLGRTPTAADAQQLPWLSATLKEAMRLYPPAAAIMSRRAVRDISIGDWLIPKGSMIRITPWHLHRDARYFSEPDRFVPERFTTPDAQTQRAWMPFGTGPRVCIGQHFAILEMTLVAAVFLQRYRMRLPTNTPAAEPVLNVTLRPKHGLKLILTRR